jgi:hypothetical protein
MKVTEPVGMVVGESTVAVNFTDCPAFAGLSDDTTLVVVVACATLIAAVPELAAETPLVTYVAVMLVVPAGILVVLSVAVVPLNGAVPRFVVPAVNLTFPVGPPGAVDVTVAVN